jgi:hypothetical protein
LSASITYFQSGDFDRQAYDACIRQAINSQLYANSIYLDAMAGEWDVLVMNDYEAVMPLPRRKKWGIHYLYQPYFVAQSGIFSRQPMDHAIATQFINAIPKKFQFINLHLNDAMDLLGTDFSLIKKHNFVLDLSRNYEAIHAAYSEDAKKNLRRSEKFALRIEQWNNPAAVVELYQRQYGKKNTMPAIYYQKFLALINQLMQTGNALCYGAWQAEALLAGAIFLKDEHRLYYILAAPTEDGRKAKAIHALIDQVIQSFAGQPLLFDFEGSDIPDVAAFYQKFSPENRPYQQLIINRLPWWLRWAKR